MLLPGHPLSIDEHMLLRYVSSPLTVRLEINRSKQENELYIKLGGLHMEHVCTEEYKILKKSKLTPKT